MNCMCVAVVSACKPWCFLEGVCSSESTLHGCLGMAGMTVSSTDYTCFTLIDIQCRQADGAENPRKTSDYQIIQVQIETIHTCVPTLALCVSAHCQEQAQCNSWLDALARHREARQQQLLGRQQVRNVRGPPRAATHAGPTPACMRRRTAALDRGRKECVCGRVPALCSLCPTNMSCSPQTCLNASCV